MRTRPGAYERQARISEALLLALALLSFLVGALLVFSAKFKDVPDERTVTDINAASGPALAAALGVPGDVGARLAAERKARGGFADVDGLGRIPIVPHPREAAKKLQDAGIPTPRTAPIPHVKNVLGLEGGALARLLAVRESYPDASWGRVLGTPLVSAGRLSEAMPGLVVRSWRDSARSFLWCGGALSLTFIAAHFLLRRFHPRADPFLLPVAAMLSFLGVLLLFALKDPVRDIPSFVAQTEGIVIGGGVALLLALSGWLGRAPLHRYGYMYALAALFGTLILGIAGSGPGGVRLSVAGAQPVEVIKVLMVFFLSAYLAERAGVLNDPLRMWGPFPIPRRADAAPLIVLYALPLALFAIVRDLGPVLLLFGAFLMLTYLATGRGVYVILGIVALGIGGYVGYALHFGVFATRVDMWLSPWANAHKSGDHLALGLWGMASGGSWGSGLGLGGAHFIPRAGSDLIFATIGEETGLWGTALVILCFLVIIGRGLHISRRAANDFDRLLAAGLSSLLALQALIIAGGCLGLFPLTGITLPLVAYGKSSLITSFFIIGMLLSLSSRATRTVPAPPPVFRIASTRLAFFFVITLGGLVFARLLWIQELDARRIAGRMVRVPDADNVTRPHVNPRLLLLASQIGRGRILDRNGIVLAETRNNRRVYPAGPLTAAIVGYVDPAIGGPTGMEARFAGLLRGFDSYESLVPLWRGKDLPGFRLPQGQNVALTLDLRLQQEALAALSAGAHAVRDRRTGRPLNRGAVVVLDVATGSILAAATLPTFDPAKLTPAAMKALNSPTSGDFPLINRVTSGYYPPGSTFKVVTATSLLANNRQDFTFVCRHEDEHIYWHAGGETYARRHIVDDEGDRPHGSVGLSSGIVQSCNIYYGHAALTLGEKALRDTTAQYGFARVPSLHDFGANLPDIGYGQGPMLVTPLEMAGVAQAIANGGKRLRPRFLRDAASDLAATPLTPEQAGIVADAMRGVTVSGTAAGRFGGLPFTVAGKTGTAQNNAYDKVAHSWFIGFAPAEKPKVAFAVIVENGGYGTAVAAPIARRVLQAFDTRGFP